MLLPLFARIVGYLFSTTILIMVQAGFLLPGLPNIMSPTLTSLLWLMLFFHKHKYTKIGAQKIKKQFSSTKKAHAHYFITSLFSYTQQLEQLLNLVFFTRYTFTNLPRCSQSINFTNIRIPYTEPQMFFYECLITDVIALLRSTTAQKIFLYYPLIIL